VPIAFDPYNLRLQFPSLSLEVNNRPAVFFDGPGGTQVPHRVTDAMVHYLSNDNCNLGGAFLTSQRTRDTVLSARQIMADFFNAQRPEEIIFGQNMTSLTFAASRAIARTWNPGDEIVVTRLDHDANITPWTLAAEEREVTVRWLDIRTEDCTLMLDDLPGLLNDKTRLVAVTFASNAVGTIVDITKVAEMAHQVGALVYVDAVHNTPHNPVDVQAMDCDFLVASAYKFFGPHTGIMYGKHELLVDLVAYKVRPSPAQPPGKWETGTQSFESIAGVKAAIEYLEMVGQQFGLPASELPGKWSGRPLRLKQAMYAIKAFEEGLSRYFLERATEVPGLRVYGITDVERLGERAPTFAVRLDGYTARELGSNLGELGIFTYAGHYYAIAVMERLGVLESGGLLRIGFAHYNTTEEIDRLVETLIRLS